MLDYFARRVSVEYSLRSEGGKSLPDEQDCQRDLVDLTIDRARVVSGALLALSRPQNVMDHHSLANATIPASSAIAALAQTLTVIVPA